MAPKAKETRGRKWTLLELKIFANVLVDNRCDFACTLEVLALTKSANFHIFEGIKETCDLQLLTETEHEKAIDTSVIKLRAMYKWMKDKWRNYTDRANSGTGKAAINEPEWFHIIDPIFSETNTTLQVASKANYLFSSESERDSDCSERCDVEKDVSEETNLTHERKRPLSVDSSVCSVDGTELGSVERIDSESDEEYDRVKQHKPEDVKVSKEEVLKKGVLKSSVSVRPRKRKVTSQKDAICQLAMSFDNLQKSQDKRMEMWADVERKREEAFFQYQEKQADLNRQHELRMMEIMARLQQPVQPQQNTVPWAIHEAAYPGSFHDASSEQPHYTNLDGYNRRSSF